MTSKISQNKSDFITGLSSPHLFLFYTRQGSKTVDSCNSFITNRRKCRFANNMCES